MKTSAVIAGALMTLSHLTNAQPIAQWTFETSPPADLTDTASISGIAADIGSGTASGVHAGATTDWSTPAGNGSANSLSVNSWAPGDYFQLQTATIGFSGISVSFDQTGSATGPRDFTFSYSTDGVNYTDFSNYSVLLNGGAPNPAWSATTNSTGYTQFYDLSSISALNNAPNVYFRIVDAGATSINGGAVGAAGTGRIDNFTVQQVPEPATFGFLALGAIALWARRFRR
jgi:hypothetical protein